jgi:hypothetical protein
LPPWTAYEEYERIRARLVQTLHENLTEDDKTFLLSIKNVTPDWSIYDFERFPAIRWKLQNLQNLKDKNPDRNRKLYETLEKKLKGVTYD